MSISRASLGQSLSMNFKLYIHFCDNQYYLLSIYLNGSKWGKEYIKAVLSPCLFNLYAEYIMRQAGIKIAGRIINNLRYALIPPLRQEVKKN